MSEVVETEDIPIKPRPKRKESGEVNLLRQIRRQEIKIRSQRQKDLADERNRVIGRKMLSSTFTTQNSQQPVPVPVGSSYFPSKRNPMFQEKYFYLGSERNFSQGESKETQELHHQFGSFFVPSLVSQCCLTISQNFESLSQELYELEIPREVLDLIESKLSRTLPLQVTVPYVTNEAYWERCCKMRWSDGQIGRVILQKEFKNWKAMYLERNLELYLEHMQSDLSIIREIQVLSQMPEVMEENDGRSSTTGIPLNTKLVNQFRKESERIRIKREAERLKRELSTNKGRKDMSLFADEIRRRDLENTDDDEPKLHEEFHTNKMTANLNYYLLHDPNAKLPTDRYKKKLRELFDGNESQGRSRLHTVSRSDDLFTFYENSIHRYEYKVPKRRGIDNDLPESPGQGFKNLRFWLLNKVPELELFHQTPTKTKKKEKVDENSAEGEREDEGEEEEESGEDDEEGEDEEEGEEDQGEAQSEQEGKGKEAQKKREEEKSKHEEEEYYDEFCSDDNISSASEYESDYEYDMEKQQMIKVRKKVEKGNKSKVKRAGERFTVPVIFPNDHDKQKLLYYVKKKQLRTLVDICRLCRSNIACLRVTAMPTFLDVNRYIVRFLPDLLRLELKYGVRNVGMSYDMDMFKMTKQDMIFLAKSMYDVDLKRRQRQDDEEEENSYAKYKREKEEKRRKRRLRRKRRRMRKKKKLGRDFSGDLEEEGEDALEVGEDENGEMSVSKTQGKGEVAERTYFFRSLEGLVLKENMIDDSMLKILVSGLIHNETIKELDLSKNRIGVQGALFLSAYVKKSKALECLNLGDNQIGSDGANFLAHALRHNTSLKVINLKFNRITNKGGVALLRAIAGHPNMREVNVSNNRLGPPCATEIAYSIIARKNRGGFSTLVSNEERMKARSTGNKKKSALEEFGLDNMLISIDDIEDDDDDPDSTVELITSPSLVEKIDCSGNMFNPRSGKLILAALKRNKKVVKLDLRLCNVMTYELNQITRILGRNNELRTQKKLMLIKGKKELDVNNLNPGFTHPENQGKYQK